MRYARIRKMDVSNGPGVRASLWTQGCHFHCDGCFNKETWDYNAGREYTQETEDKIIDTCKKKHIVGLSILGGEPLSECNLKELKKLLQRFRKEIPEKDVWLWTGYKYENLSKEQLEVANLCDVIVDGRFIDSKKDLDLQYRGSSNQRVIYKKR